jgi:uncharacterized membrane protein
MTRREIASLAIKLMGVFVLLKSIAFVPMVFSGMFYAVRSYDSAGLLQTAFVLMTSILMTVIPLAFSVLVIVLSDKAAVWLIKEDNSIENTNTSISKEDVMVIAVSCIGLYFIVAAMPMLITAFLNNAVYMRRQMGSPFIGPSGLMNIFRNLIAPAVQIALGVWLFAGSKGIVKFWKRIRS